MSGAGWRVGLCAALCLAAAATGCRRAGPADGETRAGGAVRPNVLLIVIDTLGADSVGALDPSLDTTPEIDALARQGVLFTRAYSPAPWTQPAVASLLTGLMPSEHGVVDLLDPLAAEHQTLAERLGEAGYRTAAVISHFLIDETYGFGQGFERFDDSPVGGHDAVTSQVVTRRAIRRLHELAGEPFFLFVHYFDPHYAYRHHPRHDRSSWYRGDLEPGMGIRSLRRRRFELKEDDVAYLVALYQEEVAHTDRHVGRLLAYLERLGLADDTLVILTADHGEEFMQHGWLGHTRTLYDELIRVPLIVRYPRRVRPRVVATPVSTAGIYPTVLELARGEMAGARHDGGREAVRPRTAAGLWPHLLGTEPAPARDVLAEVSFTRGAAASPASSLGEPVDPASEKQACKIALVRDDSKLILDLESGAWSLFDLAADPTETRDLADSPGAPPAELRRTLLEWARRRGGAASCGTWWEETASREPPLEPPLG